MKHSRAPLAILIISFAIAGCAPKDDVPEVVRSTNQELNELKTFDRGSTDFTLAEEIDSGLEAPRGIAATAGIVVVVGDRKLVRLDASGKPLGVVDLGAEPTCVATTPEGIAYVGLENRVLVVTPDGQKIPWAPPAGEPTITSISVDRDRIWVADAGNRLVHQYSVAGSLVKSFGRKDPKSGYPGLVVPSPHMDVVALPSGDVAVVNPGEHRVEYHSADGELKRSFGKASDKPEDFAGCCNPIDIAIFPDGRVATAEKGISRIKLYQPDGAYLGMIEKPDVFPANPPGIDLAIDSKGRILAVEPSHSNIRVYAPKGDRQT